MVRDLIRHLPPELKAKIKTALRSISDDPYRAKELDGQPGRLEKLPGGQVTSHLSYQQVTTVQIVALEPRANIYERAAVELSKMLRKGKGPLTSNKFAARIYNDRLSLQGVVGSQNLVHGSPARRDTRFGMESKPR